MKKMKLQGIVLPIPFLGILALLESCASTPKVERSIRPELMVEGGANGVSNFLDSIWQNTSP